MKMESVLDAKACARVVRKKADAVARLLSVVLQGSAVSPLEAHVLSQMTAAEMKSAIEEFVVAVVLVKNRA